MSEFVTIQEAAKLLEFDVIRLRSLRVYLFHFPTPVGKKPGRGGGYLYSRAAILHYKATRNIEDDIRHVLRKRKEDSTPTLGNFSINLENPFVKFMSGRFATNEMQRQQKKRLEQARISRPERHCVTLTPDWMTDNG